MSTTTPNFGWVVPTSTDLVKDGAAAIETLGDSIDASLVDLKGGTTGQVLSKNTNTDMDFTWVTPNDADAIQNTIVDAKADLITATAADTPARLAVGTDGQVLTADSTTATGLKWAAAAAGGWTLIATATPSAATSLSFTSIPTTYTQLRVVWDNVTQSSSSTWRVRLNNDSGNNYAWAGTGLNNSSLTYNYAATNNTFGGSDTDSPISRVVATTTGFKGGGFFQIDRASTTTTKVCTWGSYNVIESIVAQYGPIFMVGYYTTTSSITQIDFIRQSTQTITGNFYLYGLA